MASRDAVVERKRADGLAAQLAKLEAAAAEKEAAARRRGLLPVADSLDRVMRYEGHLARQLTQTLHLLERMQASRSGNPPPAPAALDVTVTA